MSDLRQALTKFDLTMIAIGGTIGSGIFLTPSLVARSLESPILILAVWVVGGLMALAGSLTFAELGGMMPGAGGMYVYLSRTYGKVFGFLFGWAYLLVVNTGGIAALSIAFATYLGYFIPLGPTTIPIVAIAGLVLLTLLNIRGVKLGGIFSDVFTLLKLLGIGGVIVVGFLWGSSTTTAFTASPSTSNLGILATAMVGVLWSYGGWQHASFTAGEAKDAKHNVPFAMITGAVCVAFVYVTINIAYMFLLPPDTMGNSSRVAADAVSVAFGPSGGSLISLAIFISTFGTAGIYTLTAPRIYYAMANDGVFFKSVAQVHPRYRTPSNAILLQSGWAIVLILFWGTFENLISYVVFTDWIFFGLTAAAIFILRKRHPGSQRPYRTWGYPLTPLFFVALAAWFVGNTLIEKPQQAWAGIIFLALGLPVYYYWSRTNHHTLSEVPR